MTVQKSEIKFTVVQHTMQSALYTIHYTQYTVKVPYFANRPNFATFGLFVAKIHWYAKGTSCQLSKR